MAGSIHVHIRHKIFLVRQCPMSGAYLQPCTKTRLDVTLSGIAKMGCDISNELPIGYQKGDLVQTSNSRLSLIDSQFKQPLCHFNTVCQTGEGTLFSLFHLCITIVLPLQDLTLPSQSRMKRKDTALLIVLKYLSNRKQRVKISSMFSSYIELI